MPFTSPWRIKSLILGVMSLSLMDTVAGLSPCHDWPEWASRLFRSSWSPERFTVRQFWFRDTTCSHLSVNVPLCVRNNKMMLKMICFSNWHKENVTSILHIQSSSWISTYRDEGMCIDGVQRHAMVGRPLEVGIHAAPFLAFKSARSALVFSIVHGCSKQRGLMSTHQR